MKQLNTNNVNVVDISIPYRIPEGQTCDIRKSGSQKLEGHLSDAYFFSRVLIFSYF